jgi:hypothetical protein
MLFLGVCAALALVSGTLSEMDPQVVFERLRAEPVLAASVVVPDVLSVAVGKPGEAPSSEPHVALTVPEKEARPGSAGR